MLKQPLICRSSKPRLDTFQKPYIPKEKRVSHPSPRLWEPRRYNPSSYPGTLKPVFQCFLLLPASHL